jgi:hypothetical protein
MEVLINNKKSLADMPLLLLNVLEPQSEDHMAIGKVSGGDG